MRLKVIVWVCRFRGDAAPRFPLTPRTLSTTILSFVPTGYELAFDDSGGRTSAAAAEDAATRMGAGFGAGAHAGRRGTKCHLDGQSRVCYSRRDLPRVDTARRRNHTIGAVPGGGGVHSASPAMQHAGWVGCD